MVILEVKGIRFNKKTHKKTYFVCPFSNLYLSANDSYESEKFHPANYDHYRVNFVSPYHKRGHTSGTYPLFFILIDSYAENNSCKVCPRGHDISTYIKSILFAQALCERDRRDIYVHICVFRKLAVSVNIVQ